MNKDGQFESFKEIIESTGVEYKSWRSGFWLGVFVSSLLWFLLTKPY